MKILRLIPSADPVSGGPIEAAHKTDAVLAARGHEVTMVTLDAADAPCLKTIPRALGLGPGLGKFGFTPRLIPWLKQHRNGFDAVIVDGLWQFPGAALHLAWGGSKTPYFVFSHGMLDPWFKRHYPLKHLKKLAYWRLLEGPFLRGAAAVLFTCDQERLQARESFSPYGLKEGIVPYCVAAPAEPRQLSVETFLQAYPELRGQRLVLFLGRLHQKKGCDLVLEAFAAVAYRDPRLRLVMAGPDQTGWKAQLERSAATLGIADRITWPGMLQGAMKWGAMSSAEVFVLPSHQENFGIAVTEALSVGTPVLISDKVNIWPEIQASGAGIVARDDLPGTITALTRWLDLAPADQQTMREAAMLCFEQKFEIGAAAEALLALMTKGRSAA